MRTRTEEAYRRERARLRNENDAMERYITENMEVLMLRELFPQEQDRALANAKQLGRESNQTNVKLDGIKFYVKE